ncbi:hypothetical protein JHK82_028125 [Glycine max]|nr:hypothetical protein JHK85_028791 [Glycine max]KAG5004110.1 hypothetical protein JHK86_028249 [Glycine max]KAG5127290.1 hypothetical protein JHK82_028125 [Glycine max]KAG5151904.1 hypothetical protein JHK84_028376 [Glycine max]
MGETIASNPTLQVSVSFGRFENDSLSWEKWSAFSPNKYLEEVEKCATPGSNVAARKAELLAQAKQKEKDSPRSQHQNGEDLSCNTCWTDAECDDTQGFMEGVKFKQETNSIGEIVRTDESNLEEDVAISRDYQGSSIEGEKENEELESRSGSSQIEKLEEVVYVEQGGSKEENPNVEAEDVKEIPHNVNKEPAQALEIEAKYVTLDHPKVSKKVCFNSCIQQILISGKFEWLNNN